MNKKKFSNQAPISKKDVTKYLDAINKAEKLANPIIDRIDTVLRIIWKVFKIRDWAKTSWRFSDESKMTILKDMLKELGGHGTILFEVLTHLADQETDEWDYCEDFPIEFLFMKDEEIKDKIESQIEKTNNRINSEENNKKKLREKVLSKLTKTEREILKNNMESI
ncbi:MAG TPA: hypothetical protein VMX17_03030 [Candidatus Glassbacteria bacterium]|nr:hypothetical protein [Candidatus Glassbacteria bacterium]